MLHDLHSTVSLVSDAASDMVKSDGRIEIKPISTFSRRFFMIARPANSDKGE
jgi:hypothetical protein